jgi:2-polyprenyl-3-methyl-5-hydroxy-6-metoxy-1,4-benzoquinol methylase
MFNMKCPCCDGETFSKKYSDITGLDDKLYNLIKCKFCGFITVSPMPSESDLVKHYSVEYNGPTKTNIFEFNNLKDFLSTNRSVYEDMSDRLSDIESIASINNDRKKTSLLDVGCSYGHMVYCAAKRGYISSGIDLDPESVSYGSKKIGLNLSVKNIYDVKDRFDIITSWMLLEHVLRPNDFIQAIYDKLNDGGIYSGSIPNAGGFYAKIKGRKWYNIIPPEHINYFNNDNLRILLEKKNFDVLFLGTISRYASPSINFGIRKKINVLISKTKNAFLKKILLGIYRSLTLVKRIFVYKLINFIILKFKLGGNGIFWVVRKNKG